MSAVASWLLQNALVATAIAALLLLATRWLRPRPGLEHVLWLLVTVKFVLPPLAVLTLPSTVIEPVVAMMPTFSAERRVSDELPVQREIAEAPSPSSAEAAPAPQSAAPSATNEADRRLPFPLMTLIVGAWLLASLVAAVWRLTRHRAWQRRVAATAARAPRGLTDIVAECAHRLRIDAPLVMLSPGAPTPLVTGLRRPVLYWPVELIGTLGVERTRTIVMHELAHLRRRDLWTGALELMVDCIWRWYPGWRIVRRRLRDSAERACDAVVVESDPQGRRQYAEAILDVLSLGARRRQAALALGVDGPGSLEVRIQGILHPQSPRAPRAVGYASVAIVALILVPWWSRGPAAPELASMSAAAPAVESRDTRAYDVEAITTRGVVRWDGRSLELEPGAWLIAFSSNRGSSRRVEASRVAGGETTLRWIVDGREARFDADASDWLRAIIERRGWDPASTRPGEVKSASGGAGTFLNWMNNRVETVSYWSTTPSHGVTRGGDLEATADAQHPVYIIHQPTADAPVEFLALARIDDRLRVLDRSLNARAAATDAAAEAEARAKLRRMTEWMFD